MNHPHHGERFLDLVGLKVSDQVPVNGIAEVGELVHLGPKFLRVVFSEVTGTTLDQGSDPFAAGLFLVTATRRTLAAGPPGSSQPPRQSGI